MKRKTIKLKCLNCNISFTTPESEIKRGFGKFCSISCSTKFARKNIPKPKPNVKCALCNKLFYKKKSALKNSKSGLYFCCKKHKDQAQKIGGIKEVIPSHYGSISTEYRKTAFANLSHKCSKCGYNKYPDVLIAHHKDRNRKITE